MPVVNEPSGEPGGIWIDYSPDSNLARISSKSGGTYIPVLAAPEGHDLVIDLEGPGIGYYQLNVHSLKERLDGEDVRSKRKVGVAVIDSGIIPSEPSMAEGISKGEIKYNEGLNTIIQGDFPRSYGDPHGTMVTDVIRRYSSEGTLAVYPVNVGTGGETWDRILLSVFKSFDGAPRHP